MDKNYDFSGWATRNDLKCSDGRTIRKDAFKHNDGQWVPLVWNHLHNDPENVLGKALLHNCDEGVRTYGYFNDTPRGQNAKIQLLHGDIRYLSIYANHLKQNGGDVLHGDIREVSLVLAGANPGAYIDDVIEHGEYCDGEAIVYTDEELSLMHSEEEPEEEIIEEVSEEPKEEPVEEKELSEEIEHADKEEENNSMADNKEKTVQEVFDTLTEEQKTVVYALIGQAVEDAQNGAFDEEEDEENMKHNVFDKDEEMLQHNEIDFAAIMSDAKRNGSLKEAFLAHTDDVDALPDYGIDNIDYLFPDAKNYTTIPDFIKRDDTWVSVVMNGTHHTPFSRIKSTHANITIEEARARGYIKGKKKEEEVFTLLKRSTTPQTIYKKQKMDRDDIVDITDFDVVAWLKGEMRMMLDEEIARAILIGDGRSTASDDHISEEHIRPVVNDDDLYSVKVPVNVAADADWNDIADAFIEAAIRARKQYKGSGNTTLFTTEDMLTDMLLLKDDIGRKLYKDEGELATTLRVKRIVTVPVMEGFVRKDSEGNTVVGPLAGIIVDLNDYNVGADKGGAVNMFDDFDIDYNQMKYLIETRCSGALIKPYSALVLEVKKAAN